MMHEDPPEVESEMNMAFYVMVLGVLMAPVVLPLLFIATTVYTQKIGFRLKP